MATQNRNDFVYNETYYANYLTRIEAETKLKLTEFEAGLCRAILDIKTKGDSGAGLGSHFKQETKRFLKEGLLHKDSLKYAGMAIPTGKLKTIVYEYIAKTKTVLTFEKPQPII